MPETAMPNARWDLSALFASMDDPGIEAAWRNLHRGADDFQTKYRGRIDREDLDSDTLLAAIGDMERLAQDLDKPLYYAQLLFQADCADPKIGAFMQSQMEKASEVRVKLIFFELELQSASDAAIDRALTDARLESYRHFVRTSRAFSPHKLSEVEEVLLEEIANTGVRAWNRLFDEVTANQDFTLRRPGASEPEVLTQEEVLTLLRDPDRAVRQAAADALTAGLGEIQKVIAFIYNNLVQDKRVEDRLRKHPYPEHSRHLSNELDKVTVDLVTSMCAERHDLVARYYHVKREVLGLPELTHIDRYAPLFDSESEIDYDSARTLILDAFGDFNQEVKDRAVEFFEKNWIDAEPRTGKTGGAFCAYCTPDTHPVILLSYLGKLKDVSTLAHELGHGVHASLSRAQTYVNFHGTLPLAELASIFGEQLVFERLVADATPQDRLALLADKIEGTFASTFRQATMFRFEQKVHAKRRDEGELTIEEFDALWQEEMQGMFGDSLRLGDQHGKWWTYVSHFFGSPFYVYAYAFGELLTLSLYSKAKAEGESFAGKYVELLRLGGSRTPFELMETVGVDLRSREFWQGGFDAIEAMIAQFETLWREHRASR
ncbi:MAG TPA: M3 family oligoendopeptidase [Fimbriimonadaceae bacterium]|nr:M3 family oligoendopeptidase [Fimbriimonadaceae bacterium]